MDLYKLYEVYVCLCLYIWGARWHFWLIFFVIVYIWGVNNEAQCTEVDWEEMCCL